MNRWRQFRASPLSRHPSLFLRKVAKRLGWVPEQLKVPAAPVREVTYPAHWERELRAWLAAVPWQPGPHPFNRVFGQEFDEDLLLRLCRDGPDPGVSGLTGDIKLIWDYSRGQPLVTNAVAGAAPLGDCEAFLRRWREANHDFTGAAWRCAMDTGIRGVNWCFADVLFGGELGRRMGTAEWAGALWQHGWMTFRHLEALMVSSNHYFANLLGLEVLGSIFPGDSTAGNWRRFAEGDFPRALLAQTRADGGANEGSLRYHAYVTEMALLFRLAQGRPFPAPAEERLRGMCQVVADFQDATGDVFAFGDDDSGRVLALDAAAKEGRVPILLRLAAQVLGEALAPASERLCPASGWWVKRTGEFTAALEFGGVGFHGQGGHAHNDDLSLAVDWRGHPVIVDPGSYLYTADRVARNRLRSTVVHNTIMVDGREQRVMTSEPFELIGSDAPGQSERVAPDTWAFTCARADGVRHRREITGSTTEIRVRDTIEGRGTHSLRWRFTLHPHVTAEATGLGWRLSLPGVGTLRLETGTPQLSRKTVASEFSPGYGKVESTLGCVAEGKFTLPCTLEWRLSVEG